MRGIGSYVKMVLLILVRTLKLCRVIPLYTVYEFDVKIFCWWTWTIKGVKFFFDTGRILTFFLWGDGWDFFWREIDTKEYLQRRIIEYFRKYDEPGKSNLYGHLLFGLYLSKDRSVSVHFVRRRKKITKIKKKQYEIAYTQWVIWEVEFV